MKTLLTIGLITLSSMAYADVELVPLDMEFGYWETTTEMLESEALKNVLASVPEAQRDQVRAMMASQTKMPITKQCITAETFENFEEKFKESMGGQTSCKFIFTKSTSQEFSGSLNCGAMVTTLHTKVINSKRQETEAVSTAGQMGQTKIRNIAEWKSATCPADVTP